MTISLIAQTESDFRQKYQALSIVEKYKIRPNVIATVKYGLNGKLDEILIETTAPISDCAKLNASNTINDEIVDELVPLSMRGGLMLGFTGGTSGNSMRSIEMYSNLSINRKINYCNVKVVSYSSVFISFTPFQDLRKGVKTVRK